MDSAEIKPVLKHNFPWNTEGFALYTLHFHSQCINESCHYKAAAFSSIISEETGFDI